jgi:hypothetical protein
MVRRTIAPKRALRGQKRTSRLTVRFETKAGEQLQSDWHPEGTRNIVEIAGKATKVYLTSCPYTWANRVCPMFSTVPPSFGKGLGDGWVRQPRLTPFPEDLATNPGGARANPCLWQPAPRCGIMGYRCRAGNQPPCRLCNCPGATPSPRRPVQRE